MPSDFNEENVVEVNQPIQTTPASTQVNVSVQSAPAQASSEEADDDAGIIEESRPTVTEIHFTDEQAAAIQRAIEVELYGKKTFLQQVSRAGRRFFCGIFELLMNIITLKNSGKWVSIITIGFILFVLTKFLLIHAFSVEAMAIVIPHISQIGILVFTIIGGVKGLTGIIEKLGTNSTVLNKVREISSRALASRNPTTPPAANTNVVVNRNTTGTPR